MSFPDKSKRQKCWDARDEYWKCLDKNSPDYSATSGQEGPSECLKLRKLFETGCPAQWVKHFDRKRTYEQFKEKMNQGFDPVNQEKAPK